LSTVLLGLRTHLRLDTGASPADFVYGTSLRIPGEFLSTPDYKPDPHIFLEDFREYMRQIKPVPVAHKNKLKTFVFDNLTSCTHVFLLRKNKKSLERPYTGPHRVIERCSDRVYIIDVNGCNRTVSIELLKPAHFLSDNENTPTNIPLAQLPQPDASPKRVTFSDKLVLKRLTPSVSPKTVRSILKST